jgi:hypothetical protein
MAHGCVSRAACADVEAATPRWHGHRLPPRAHTHRRPYPLPCRSRSSFEHFHSHALVRLCSLCHHAAPSHRHHPTSVVPLTVCRAASGVHHMGAARSCCCLPDSSSLRSPLLTCHRPPPPSELHNKVMAGGALLQLASARWSAGCPETRCSSRTSWAGRSAISSSCSSRSSVASRWRPGRGGSSCLPPSCRLSLADHPSSSCCFAPGVEALQLGCHPILCSSRLPPPSMLRAMSLPVVTKCLVKW